MNKTLSIVAITIFISACSDGLVDDATEKTSEPVVSENVNLLSLLSEKHFSKFEFKSLIDPNTDKPEMINICNVNHIVSEGHGEVTIDCSNKERFITNGSAKEHVRKYEGFSYIQDRQASDKMQYLWGNNEVSCILTVDEDKDIFQLYCG